MLLTRQYNHQLQNGAHHTTPSLCGADGEGDFAGDITGESSSGSGSDGKSPDHYSAGGLGNMDWHGCGIAVKCRTTGGQLEALQLCTLDTDDEWPI